MTTHCHNTRGIDGLNVPRTVLVQQRLMINVRFALGGGVGGHRLRLTL
jgi:hypothetical protein